MSRGARVGEPVEDRTTARALASSARATSPSSPSAAHPRGALRAALAELGARGASPSARATFAALWTFTDPAGRAWPSQRTLARVTGRCERTVRSNLGELARLGALARDVPTLTDRRRARRTTVYLLLPLAPHRPRAPASAPPAPETRPGRVNPAPSSLAALERPPAGPPGAVDAPEVSWAGEVEVEFPELHPAPSSSLSPLAGLAAAPELPELPELHPQLPEAPPRPSPATAPRPSPATGPCRSPKGEKSPPARAPTSSPRPHRAPELRPAPRPGVARALPPPLPPPLAALIARCTRLAARGP